MRVTERERERDGGGLGRRTKRGEKGKKKECERKPGSQTSRGKGSDGGAPLYKSQ